MRRTFLSACGLVTMLFVEPRKRVGYKTPYEVFFPIFVVVWHLPLDYALRYLYILHLEIILTLNPLNER